MSYPKRVSVLNYGMSVVHFSSQFDGYHPRNDADIFQPTKSATYRGHGDRL